MENELAAALTEVLKPFPEAQREQMVAWASGEMRSKSLITLCQGKGGDEWKVGEQSPCNANTTVFAMLMDTMLRCVDVYTFGNTTDGGTLYFKETVWDPSYTSGPMSGDALWDEWSKFFGEGDEPAPPGTNGDASAGDAH